MQSRHKLCRTAPSAPTSAQNHAGPNRTFFSDAFRQALAAATTPATNQAYDPAAAKATAAAPATPTNTTLH